MTTTEIRSVYDVLTYVYNLGSLNSTFKFRGQSDFDWTLQPSIYRYENLNRAQTVLFEEALLGQKPPKPIPHILNTSLEVEWLMLCQHYNIPTRLLDWTSDVLVALFFACRENKDIDGAIFICNQNDYSSIPAIDYDLMEVQDLAFINTSVVNPRMRAQSGCFMVWGHSPLNNEVSTESYDLCQFHEINRIKNHFIEKIKIPKECKKQILYDLKKYYEISFPSLYIMGGILEETFKNEFKSLQKKALLCTLYLTDSTRLNASEVSFTKLMLPSFGENVFKGCINLKSIKGVFRNNHTKV